MRVYTHYFVVCFLSIYITYEMRDIYGAYETLFFYYANCDYEEFHKIIWLTVPQFRKLHKILAPRLLKTSLLGERCQLIPK